MDATAAIGIEISDLDVFLAIASDDGSVLQTIDSGHYGSAASAWLNGRHWVVGNKARQQSIQLPHLCIDGFWESISMDPVDVGGRRPLRAELANFHLEAILRQSGIAAGRVVVAVPGTFRGVTGLLPGLVTDNGLQCVSLLDAAIASLLALPDAARGVRHVIVVDVSLRSTSLTVLDLNGGIERQQVRLLEKTGWEQIHQALVRWLRNESVRRTRYDPLHNATGEQDLVNQLYTVLQTPDEDSPESVDFSGPGAMTVARADFAAHCREAVATIAEALVSLLERYGGTTVVLLNHRAARIPGIATALRGIGVAQYQAMHPGCAALGAVEFLSRLDAFGEQLSECRFVTHLSNRFLSGDGYPTSNDADSTPADNAAATATATTTVNADSNPDDLDRLSQVTHLLFRGEVYPLVSPVTVVGSGESAQIAIAGDCPGVSRRHCEIRRVDGKWVVTDVSRYGTTLDGVPLTAPQPVQVGSILALGSDAVQLMAVRVHQ